MAPIDVVVDRINIRDIARNGESMARIHAAVEGQVGEEQADTICEAFVRRVVRDATARLTATFARALKELTDVEERIQRAINTPEANVPGRTRAEIDRRIQPDLAKRAELVDAILLIVTDSEGGLRGAVDAEPHMAALDEGLEPEKAPDEDRADISTQPDDPNLPRASRDAAAEVQRGLAPLQPRDRRWRLSPTRRSNRPYAHEQMMLLRDLDPIAASRGYEVRFGGWDYDDPARSLDPSVERPLDLDGIRPLGGDRFEMLEAKYASEELAPGDEPQQDQIDHMRAQFSRQLEAMRALQGQAELRVVTNSPSLAEFIQGMLCDLAHIANPADLDAAGIHVEVRAI